MAHPGSAEATRSPPIRPGLDVRAALGRSTRQVIRRSARWRVQPRCRGGRRGARIPGVDGTAPVPGWRAGPPSQRSPGSPTSAMSCDATICRVVAPRSHRVLAMSSSPRPGSTCQRPSRWSPHGVGRAGASKPHSSQRRSTWVRCCSSSSGVQPDGRRLSRSSPSGNATSASAAGA